MKVILTSFAMNIESKDCVNNPFYKTPPMLPQVFTNRLREVFIPDYTCLLLAEKIVMDEESFDFLKHRPHPGYDSVSELYTELFNLGFIELTNFKKILKQNESLFKFLIAKDMRAMKSWLKPLTDSMSAWNNFMVKFRENATHRLYYYFEEIKNKNANIHNSFLNHAFSELHPVPCYSKTPKEMAKEELKGLLKNYLSYINSNIILSIELDCCFHDWSDFQPFYNHKFKQKHKRKNDFEAELLQARKLFEISFPEFRIKDNKSVIKAITDKRIEKLRILVSDAVEGKVEFDEEFGRKVLMEVFHFEKAAKKFSKITSFAALPLTFLPPLIGTPLQISSEKLAQAIYEKKLKKNLQWFYLLSEIVDN